MPNLQLTTDELPEIADWTPGESYTVVLDVTLDNMTGNKGIFTIDNASTEQPDTSTDQSVPAKSTTAPAEPVQSMANGGDMKSKMIDRMKQKASQY